MGRGSIFLFLVLTACGESTVLSPLGIEEETKESPPKVCSPKISTFHHKKYKLSEFKSISSGSQIALLIDGNCERIESLSQDPFYQSLKAAQKDFSQNFHWPQNWTREQLFTFIDQNECILGASPVRKFELQALTNDTYASQLTHLQHTKFFENLEQINLDLVQAQPTLVAVIDTGQWLDHPDMKENLWVNLAEQNGQEGVDDDQNGIIDDIHGANFNYNTGNPVPVYSTSHGNHVAGLIGAHINNNEGIVGVMGQKTQILPINVFYRVSPIGGGNAVPTHIAIDNAIRYAADMGADVINMSLGGAGLSATTQAALEYAVQKGSTVIVSAGNGSREINQDFEYIPAFYAKDIKGMLAVAATNSKDANLELCSFSNFSSSYVEIAAPGCDTNATNGEGVAGPITGLLSTVRSVTDEDLYDLMAGTSMSSPVAAGAAALVIAYHKTYKGTSPTPAQVEDILKQALPAQQNLQAKVEGARHLQFQDLVEYLRRLYILNQEEPPPVTSPPEC